jgi:hypothetical protein
MRNYPKFESLVDKTHRGQDPASLPYPLREVLKKRREMGVVRVKLPI